MQKSWKLRWDHNCLAAELSGEVDHHIAAQLRAELDAELREKPETVHLLLDFSGVTFMDSSGIGVIMGRYKQMSYVGGTVYVYGVGKNVDRIFQMSGLYKLVKQWNQAEVQ